MARPRGFDEDRILDCALELFWTKGFEATTLDDLEQVTGLRRGSIYAAFGDKRRLFSRALGRYAAARERERAALLDEEAGRAAIIAFFEDAVRSAKADPLRRGCLLTNCAFDSATRNNGVAEDVERSLATTERLLGEAVRRACERGEITTDQQPRVLARLLMTVHLGIQVMARGPADAQRLDDVMTGVEGLLPAGLARGDGTTIS